MNLLEVAERFLIDEVAPHAEAMDASPEALRPALQGLCERGLMALRRPTEFGGPAMPEGEFRQFQESVARRSGSLAFLQTQHQSAGSMISKSDNADLKAQTLPLMADGGRLIGIGFSQLRRPGKPMVTATPVSGGFVLNGEVPWVTGWTFFPEFLIGATLPSGEAVFGIVPFAEREGISVSEPMKLAAMESALTVSIQLNDHRLAEEDVVFVKPAKWIQNNDQINVTLQGHFAIGCARAGLDLLWSAYEKKQLPFIESAFRSLLAEWEDCREATAAAPSSELATPERLGLRAWAIDLAVRCAHAAIAAHSGAANARSHPAQRVYREALVYTVSAQTSEIMQATLERLVKRSGAVS